MLHKLVWQISYQRFPIHDGQPKRPLCCFDPPGRMTTVFIKQTNKTAAMLQEEKVQCLAWILQRSLHILPDTCCIPSGFSGMSVAAMLQAVCHIVWASWRRTQVLFCTASSPQLSFSLPASQERSLWKLAWILKAELLTSNPNSSTSTLSENYVFNTRDPIQAREVCV